MMCFGGAGRWEGEEEGEHKEEEEEEAGEGEEKEEGGDGEEKVQDSVGEGEGGTPVLHSSVWLGNPVGDRGS